MPLWGLDVVFDESLVKILLSCLLCGLIGLEREYRQKAAGFRTHMLVGLGSTLFTLLSLHGFGASDPSRIAAQIVSGIGFIGGGAILRHGLSVRGVTTAATLWLVAAIGMAMGVGWYEPGLFATAMALLTLMLLTNLERYLPSLPTAIQVQLRLGIAVDQQPVVREMLEASGWEIRRGQIERLEAGGLRMVFTIRHPAGRAADVDDLIAVLQGLPGGLREIGWEVLEVAS
ncbi:MAG: MgtC/SapB family protein [Candidatus Sericytochromatia bacterium]